MKIAVIGAGWYGSHVACALAKEGHQVILFEKNADIFGGISGSFGVRLHIGPHYPRSDETRKYCRKGFDELIKTYGDLINPHLYAIYALGKTDADGKEPKVDAAKFKSVCMETQTCHKIDPTSFGYDHLISAYKVDEPSIAVGERLRDAFRRYLRKFNVTVVCNFSVHEIRKLGDDMLVSNNTTTYRFNAVINATSYQAFVSPLIKLPFNLKVTYQLCLALVYKDNRPSKLPFSFIVMDGWFPCLMPYQENINPSGNYDPTYIMTHGKFTILGSYSTPKEAKDTLDKIDDAFVESHIKPRAEAEMHRFWPGIKDKPGVKDQPGFKERFTYLTFKATVLAKPITDGDFRTAVTYKNKTDGIIHIIPGKINNIFQAAEEVMSLLKQDNILTVDDCEFAASGVLPSAKIEISDKPQQKDRSTCMLQTYKELTPKNPVSRIRKANFSFWPIPEEGSAESSSEAPQSKRASPSC